MNYSNYKNKAMKELEIKRSIWTDIYLMFYSSLPENTCELKRNIIFIIPFIIISFPLLWIIIVFSKILDKNWFIEINSIGNKTILLTALLFCIAFFYLLIIDENLKLHFLTDVFSSVELLLLLWLVSPLITALVCTVIMLFLGFVMYLITLIQEMPIKLNFNIKRTSKSSKDSMLKVFWKSLKEKYCKKIKWI